MTPLGFREEGRYYWLMTDARGAVDLALDDQGQVVWKASYDSFGNANIEVNLVRQPWRLQGQYADEETGLYYNFARYYSPHLRSYLSLDPRWIEFDASHYSYCRNDPWNRADPFGGLAPLLVLGIAGVVGGLVGGITAVVTGGDPLAGAVEGAVGGAGAVVAVVAGASAAVVVAAGIVATGVGAFAGQMTEQARRGNKVSIKCALMGAAIAAATDLVLLGLGKVPFVKQLAKWAGKKLAKLVKPLKKFAKGKLNQAKGLLKKLKGRSKLDKALTRRAKRAAKVRQRAISRSNMVPKHAEAFSEVAQVRDEFILTRPVNPDAKAMIANGSATKSMHIKGKSSDWGPMKGAIPVDQNYSKLAKGDPAEIAAKQLEVDTLLNPKAGGPVYAKSVPLVVDGKTVLVVKNAAPPPATVIQKGNHFFSATPPGDPIPASKVKPSGSEPLMVLGDPETGAPITADYDLLAIGHNKLEHPDGSAFVKAPYDSELGVMTPAEADTLDALQKATQGKTGDQRVVHHGPEVNNPKPEKFSGPVTAYCPDGSVRSIDTESGLVDLFNEANAKGYRMEPNPGWGWQKNAQTGWWGLP